MIPAVLAAILHLQPRLPPKVAHAYATTFLREAQDVDPFLLVALAYRESSFRSRIENEETGARGLFQIAKVHWQTLRPRTSVWSPSTNTRTAVKLLRQYLSACNGDVPGALSRYHGTGTCKADTWAWETFVLAGRLRVRFAQPKVAA